MNFSHLKMSLISTFTHTDADRRCYMYLYVCMPIFLSLLFTSTLAACFCVDGDNFRSTFKTLLITYSPLTPVFLQDRLSQRAYVELCLLGAIVCKCVCALKMIYWNADTPLTRQCLVCACLCLQLCSLPLTSRGRYSLPFKLRAHTYAI